MKKGPFIFLLILCAGVCIMIGTLIGRRTSTNYYSVENVHTSTSENRKEQTADTTELGKLNINSATVDELISLPGIGETIAQRIVDYRKSVGLFESIEELTQVEGIGETRLEAIRDYITVGG